MISLIGSGKKTMDISIIIQLYSKKYLKCIGNVGYRGIIAIEIMIST